jgi:hypothetical protein
VIHVARLVQFLSALLLAYGTSYGPRPTNAVFVIGVALVVLMTVAIYERERNALRAIWPAAFGFALLFVWSGLPLLGLPQCETATSAAACASASAHARTIAALALIGCAVAAAAVDGIRSWRTA